MSRNLSADHCVLCGYGPVTIADVAGKPVELRSMGRYVPKIGVRWDCPRCGTAYFAHWRTRGDCIGCHISSVYPDDFQGTWEVDLSYWSTYNDEPDWDDMFGETDTPRGLVTENFESHRFSLGVDDPRSEDRIVGPDFTIMDYGYGIVSFQEAYATAKNVDTGGPVLSRILDTVESDTFLHFVPMINGLRLVEAVLRNPNCPVHILKESAESDSEQVRVSVASNVACPEVLWVTLLDDPSPEVLQALVGNMGISERVRTLATIKLNSSP